MFHRRNKIDIEYTLLNQIDDENIGEFELVQKIEDSSIIDMTDMTDISYPVVIPTSNYSSCLSCTPQPHILKKCDLLSKSNLPKFGSPCSIKYIPERPNENPIIESEEFPDLIDLTFELEQKLEQKLEQEQLRHTVQIDKSLQDVQELEFEIIKFPYTYENIPRVARLSIRCSDNTITILNDKIITTKPVLINVSINELKIWDAYYTENRNMVMDGTTVLNGYTVRDFDDKKIFVKDKIIMKEFPVNLVNMNYIDFQGDESEIIFENNIFNDKIVTIKSRGYSKINLGMSNFINAPILDVKNTIINYL